MKDETDLEKVKDILKKRKINTSESIEFLDSLIEASDDDVFREECIRTLSFIAPKSDKAYDLLENYLVSDDNPKIRVIVIELLVENFSEKSQYPLLWIIKNDNSPLVLSKLAEIAENHLKYKYPNLYKTFISKFNSLASKLGIEGKEFKFILDIEYQLTKNWKANKVGKEFFEFYKNLTKIGEHPWLIIEKNHVKKLSFNYFNWKFLRESSELMSSISKLEYVELFLSIIKKYNIDYSIIKSIPQSIGNLSELKSLNLSYNNLTKIPKSIVRLDKLRILNLSHNNLKTLPDISSMKRLRDLNLSHNNFNEIPHSVEKVKNTLNLNIDSNPIR